jgi:hypothetical protein
MATSLPKTKNRERLERLSDLSPEQLDDSLRWLVGHAPETFSTRRGIRERRGRVMAQDLGEQPAERGPLPVRQRRQPGAGHRHHPVSRPRH